LSERGKLGAQAGLVLVKRTNQYALPGFALRGEEQLVVSVQHDGASAEPRLEDKRRFTGERFGQPLKRMFGFYGAGFHRRCATRFHQVENINDSRRCAKRELMALIHGSAGSLRSRTWRIRDG